MIELHIITDASDNKNYTIGSYLFLDNISHIFLTSKIDKETFHMNDLNILTEGEPQSIQYNSLTSTIGELTTILDVLKLLEQKFNDLENRKIYLYTDCKNLINIHQKTQFEHKFKEHRNYSFYKQIIDRIDKYKIQCYWTKGHNKKDLQVLPIQILFSKVDKHARRKLRELTIE